MNLQPINLYVILVQSNVLFSFEPHETQTLKTAITDVLKSIFTAAGGIEALVHWIDALSWMLHHQKGNETGYQIIHFLIMLPRHYAHSFNIYLFYVVTEKMHVVYIICLFHWASKYYLQVWLLSIGGWMLNKSNLMSGWQHKICTSPHFLFTVNLPFWFKFVI